MSSLRMTGEGKGAENRFGYSYRSRERLASHADVLKGSSRTPKNVCVGG